MRKSELKDRQGQYEDDVVERLHELLSEDVQVTLLADRGFGNLSRPRRRDGLPRRNS